jgi:hypothetical protein
MTLIFVPSNINVAPNSVEIVLAGTVTSGDGYVIANTSSDSPFPAALLNVIMPVDASDGTSIFIIVLLMRCVIVASAPPIVAEVTLLSDVPVTVISHPAYPSVGVNDSIVGALTIVSFIDNSSHDTMTIVIAASAVITVFFMLVNR